MAVRRFTDKPMRRRQRGDMLLESMVAMALAGIVAMGPAYIVSRASVSQTQSNAHSDAVMQLRELLQQKGAALCDDPSTSNISVAGQSLTVTVTCTSLLATPITVGGTGVDLTGSSVSKRVSLSVSNSFFGGSETIVVAQ